MSSGDSIGLIQALGFIAWSDERLAPEEKDMLNTVMNVLDIPEARRTELCASLEKAPPDFATVVDSFTDDTERRFAVAQTIMMAQADGVVSPSEKRDIGKLAAAFGIEADELEMLYAAVAVTGDLSAGPP